MTLAAADPATSGSTPPPVTPRRRGSHRRPPRVSRAWRLILAAGVVLVVVGAAVLAVQWGRPDTAEPTTFGRSDATAAVPSAGSTGTSASSPTTTPTAAPTAAPPASPTGPPVRLQIPSLGVDAQVVDAFQTGGVIQVPENPSVVGWWVGSAVAGSPAGTTVLVGHVDTAEQGVGVLSSLAEVVEGTEIVLTTTEGGTITYAVTGRDQLSKSGGLPPETFAPDGPPRLVLITCGGPFDPRAASYDDNVIVYAVPV